MIGFLRRIRKKLANNNQFIKYSRYAIGEIVLVVIGILIALQLNQLKQKQENDSTHDYYTNAILEDLKQDSISIEILLKSSQEQISLLNNQMLRIFNPTSTIDTLINIARFEFDNTFPTIQYNDNNFKTIISSGYADLFDKEVINKLMELDECHRAEHSDSKSNSETYRTQLAAYYRNYSPSYGLHSNNLIDRIIWADVDEKDFVGKFRAMFFMKIFMTKQFIEHLFILQKKTHETVSYMRK